MVFKLSKRKKVLIRNLLLVVLTLGAMASGVVALWIANMQIPHLDTFEQRRIEQSTRIYDRTGEILLYDVFGDVKRTVVPNEEISDHVKYATLAIEDRDFYKHQGIQPRAFLRAVWVNLTTQELAQGGSTITQQVVKNSVLGPEKEVSRKIKEWIFSVRLEQIMEKDEILNLYLNETPYGGSIYGVEEAARSYFGTTASDLTIAQSAYLAALPQAPTYLSPYGGNRELLEARKDYILAVMRNEGFISDQEYLKAKQEEVRFLPQEKDEIRAPHFVMYVLEQLEREYGREKIEKGLKVKTSLDYDLHRKAQSLAYEYAISNEARFQAENMGVSAVDPRTGEILVMVGSRGYFDDGIDGNYNVTTAKRQPGSAFKPFAYAEAFDQGFTPDTILFDLRTQFSTACDPNEFTSAGNCYSPQNYDLSFRGPMTMRDALAQSVNVPAVKALYLAGIENTGQLVENMGIKDLEDVAQYGLTLVLGGGEVSLLDMTQAYGVFANQGEKVEETAILEITDRRGNIIKEQQEPHKDRVLDKETSLLISDVLSDNQARTPMFGAESMLHFPGEHVAVKTGTTNNYRDAWVIGYTNDIAVGAWAGNNDNSPMNQQVAGMIIAPMWNEFMKTVLQERPSSAFEEPEYLSRDNSQLKPVLRGQWLNVTQSGNDQFTGSAHSILHWVDRNNPQGPPPSNPYQDSQYIYWETPVRAWATRRGFGEREEQPETTNEEINDLETDPEELPEESDPELE